MLVVINELIFAVLTLAVIICAVPTAEVREEIEDPVNCVAVKTPTDSVSEEIDDPVNCVAFKTPVFVTSDDMEL